MEERGGQEEDGWVDSEVENTMRPGARAEEQVLESTKSSQSSPSGPGTTSRLILLKWFDGRHARLQPAGASVSEIELCVALSGLTGNQGHATRAPWLRETCPRASLHGGITTPPFLFRFFTRRLCKRQPREHATRSAMRG